MLLVIKEAVVEVLRAVLPIILIIVVLKVGVLRVAPSDLLLFLLGSGMIVLGIALFLSGVKAGLLPIGVVLDAIVAAELDRPGVGLAFVIPIRRIAGRVHMFLKDEAEEPEGPGVPRSPI